VLLVQDEQNAGNVQPTEAHLLGAKANAWPKSEPKLARFMFLASTFTSLTNAPAQYYVVSEALYEQALGQALLARWWKRRFSIISLKELKLEGGVLYGRFNCICRSCLSYISCTVIEKQQNILFMFTVVFQDVPACEREIPDTIQFRNVWMLLSSEFTLLATVILTFRYMAAAWNHHDQIRVTL
jgi:hypothetical protein